ncbi:hypothetical protein DEO72_LG6g548 [Vigna unguiculata]|uniref:Uncharacterized protein n=1 Tax=Vigna unguiculata TaxID=3917 RepID=A0A4D6M5T5_VIGUN|nr:hypothetical protein DEO72_LG6g548 [Vigna unguiculata]
MNLPVHGTTSPDPRLHQCVQTTHINCTKLAWARSLSASDQVCLAYAKLPRLSERATGTHCEVSLRQAFLAWARLSFTRKNKVSRLGGETSKAYIPSRLLA